MLATIVWQEHVNATMNTISPDCFMFDFLHVRIQKQCWDQFLILQGSIFNVNYFAPVIFNSVLLKGTFSERP